MKRNVAKGAGVLILNVELPVQEKGLLGSEWLSESIRLTAFRSPQESPAPFWSQLADGEPSEVVRRPQEGILNEVGLFGAGNLIVSQQVGRTDIILSPAMLTPPVQVTPIEAVPAPDIHHIGPAASALSIMLKSTPRLGPIFEAANRIAFSMVFLRKATNDQESNNILCAYEKLPINDTDTDIVWRINRSMPAQSFNGRLNRILSWQTAKLLTQRFSFPQNLTISAPTSSPTIHFVRAEIEVNTIKSDLSDLRPLEHWKDTFDEVLSRACELMIREN